jgi:hypothetical protein
MEVKRGGGAGGGLLLEHYNAGEEGGKCAEEESADYNTGMWMWRSVLFIAHPIPSTRDCYGRFLLHDARPVCFPFH